MYDLPTEERTEVSVVWKWWNLHTCKEENTLAKWFLFGYYNYKHCISLTIQKNFFYYFVHCTQINSKPGKNLIKLKLMLHRNITSTPTIPIYDADCTWSLIAFHYTHTTVATTPLVCIFVYIFDLWVQTKQDLRNL